MIAAMMLVMLFACNGNGNGDGSGSADDAPELVTLCADGASEYKIVRPDSDYGKVLKEAVGALRTAVKKAAGVELDVAEDWVKDTADIPGAAKEILVGATNRPESISALKELKTDDFCVRFFAESGRVVIVGGSDEATSEAVDYFIKNFAGTDGGGVAMKKNVLWRRGMTLLEAIVGAGDITDWGSRYVQVTRGGKTVTYDYFSIKDRAIPIQPNDRIFVPQRGIFEGRPAKLLP